MEDIKLNIDHHDRPYLKRFWIKFFICGILLYSFAFWSPNPLELRSAQPIKCQKELMKSLGYKCSNKGVFDIKKNPILTVAIDTYLTNHFLALQGVPSKIKSLNNDQFSEEINFKVTAYYYENGINNEKSSEGNLRSIEKEQIYMPINCNKVHDGYCEPAPIMTIPKVQRGQYIFIIEIVNNEDLQQMGVEDLILAFQTGNSSFYMIMIGFRYIVTLISVISFLKYHSKVRNLTSRMRISEQNILWYLGFFLILQNDPLYLFTATNRVFAGVMFAQTCKIIFSALLIYFWFVNLERIKDGDDFGTLKKCIGISATLLYLITSMLNYYQHTTDFMEKPLLFYGNNPHFKFNNSKTPLMTVSIILFIWMIRRVIQLAKKRNEVSDRDRNFLVFSEFFIIVEFMYILTGSLQVYNDNQVRHILFIGLSNMYVLFMLSWYSPIPGSFEELAQLQDKQSPQQDQGELELERRTERLDSNTSEAYFQPESTQNEQGAYQDTYQQNEEVGDQEYDEGEQEYEDEEDQRNQISHQDDMVTPQMRDNEEQQEDQISNEENLGDGEIENEQKEQDNVSQEEKVESNE